MSSSAEAELPVVFPYHVFCCFQQRPAGHPRGSCAVQGAAPLWQRLSAKLQGKPIASVSMVGTGCLGFCSAGPLMVVYPQGVWYAPKTEEDIDEIIASHLEGGQIVDRLAMILKP